MPDLLHSLQGYDLGHLRIIAELWGMHLHAREPDAAILEIVTVMHDDQSLGELIETLRPPARAALAALEQASGRVPWALFIREFGDVREMGAAKRDREKPYLKTASGAEDLFYRGLLGRAFFETGEEAQEFAYIPTDYLSLIQQHLPDPGQAPARPFGRPAEPSESASAIPATDRVLDDVTTLLAARRAGQAVPPNPVLQALVQAAGILQGDTLQAQQAKAFLEASRADALRMLVEAWRASDKFNELRLMPDLVCEGEWRNRPLAARGFLLKRLGELPRQTWWNLPSFIEDIKKQHPDFQRPAGDYDSWFVKDAASGRYLRGFTDWDRVDGALIQFLVVDVMHRLGMLDLAGPAAGQAPSAFRIGDIEGREARFPKKESGRLRLTSQGKITAARLVPRAARYQLARFCDWDESEPDQYHYHISPESLDRARRQGLKVEQLLTLLRRHTDPGIPAAVTKAVTRWEARGLEARAETHSVLRVSRPEIIKQLRDSKARRFLGEALGPTAVIMKQGAETKVVAALAELGILADDRTTKNGIPGGIVTPAGGTTQSTAKPGAQPKPKK